MIGPEPICMQCKHLIKPPPGEFGFKCDAFPDGIPEEIFSGEVEHTKPYPGDHGIMFEVKE